VVLIAGVSVDDGGDMDALEVVDRIVVEVGGVLIVVDVLENDVVVIVGVGVDGVVVEVVVDGVVVVV